MAASDSKSYMSLGLFSELFKDGLIFSVDETKMNPNNFLPGEWGHYTDPADPSTWVALPEVLTVVKPNTDGSVPVCGNGKSLGLYDGTTYVAPTTSGTEGKYLQAASNGYNKDAGTGGATGGTWSAVSKAIGITTEPDKSGIVIPSSVTSKIYKWIKK